MKITFVLSTVLLTTTGVAHAQYGLAPASQQNPVQRAASALQQSAAAQRNITAQQTAAMQRAAAAQRQPVQARSAPSGHVASVASRTPHGPTTPRLAMNNVSNSASQVIGGPMDSQPTPAPVVPGGPAPGWTNNLTIPVQGGTGLGAGGGYGGNYGGGGLGYSGGGMGAAYEGGFDGGAACGMGCGSGTGPGGASNAYGGSLGASGFPWPGYAYGGPYCWYRHPCFRWFYWRSTGDMVQHVPYFPNAHGYYYYRPYNVIHVLQQQEMSARWGLDTRNPYDNRFFQRIYEEQEQAEKAEKSLQAMESDSAMVGLPIPQWNR